MQRVVADELEGELVVVHQELGGKIRVVWSRPRWIAGLRLRADGERSEERSVEADVRDG